MRIQLNVNKNENIFVKFFDKNISKIGKKWKECKKNTPYPDWSMVY